MKAAGSSFGCFLIACLSVLATACDSESSRPTELVGQISEAVTIGVAEGFESGNLTAGGWLGTANASVVASAAQSGAFGARLGAGGVMRTTIDTTGFRGIQVQLDWRGVGLDAGEYAALEWAPATGAFSEVARITTNGSWSQLAATLPEGADNRPGVRLRLRVSAFSLTEFEGVEVDDLLTSGTADLLEQRQLRAGLPLPGRNVRRTLRRRSPERGRARCGLRRQLRRLRPNRHPAR